MKVGILTFHNAHNYGAVLQAYALRTKLRKMGFSAEIINYRNPKIENAYVKKIVPKKIKVSLFHPKSFLLRRQKVLEAKYAQSSWEKRCVVFETFIHKVLLENQTSLICANDLKDLEYGAFICGSDQIWTDYLTGGLDRVYFLDFESGARKISYGASKVNASFSDVDRVFFAEKLRSFHAVSVREKELAIALSDICNREISVVVDPTLLLTREEYGMIEEPIPEQGEYVLAYFLAEEPLLMECAQKAAKDLGVKLIEIHYYKQRTKGHFQVTDCGPGEFLTYVKNAKYVFTNSFHGTVFSIIYEKEFYAVYNEDSRKNNLLQLLGLEDRHIHDSREMDFQTHVDYSLANELLLCERTVSEVYLKVALQS